MRTLSAEIEVGSQLSALVVAAEKVDSGLEFNFDSHD